ncbi:SEN34 subunit of tRNA-splicing endonuclease [Teratosphaeria nubilosa]|uniref:tRNA-splicing endonuclease subunit Sen34 n=1 Tax=Teratosphaeria nubilosa TaxID=161662 RepID=A0A6G1LIK9_9PEZI|nr:SEN34 subunit of tRNA-splicing endonuclease [Teratosphaeria nubilosa]
MATTNSNSVSEPFPIFKLAHRYLLYDVDTISYIRARYNIAGVLIGGLPQAPQQNVFSGIPLELMPEEARLLVEKGVAHIVDDTKAHKEGFLGDGLGEGEKRAYRESLRRQGTAAVKQVEKRKQESSKAALSKKLGVSDWNDIPEDMFQPSRASTKKKKGRREPGDVSGASTPRIEEGEESLFGAGGSSRPPLSLQTINASTASPPPYGVTPATSYPPLSAQPPSGPPGSSEASELDLGKLHTIGSSAQALPEVPPSYPLFKHLHEKDYFMTPGLRFGCQYTAYPGDPLRFHSHFLANGMEWDEEFSLLDVVGGGRLGTGVKKGFLIGGEEERKPNTTNGEANGGDHDDDTSDGNVRAFCIEWAGM